MTLSRTRPVPAATAAAAGPVSVRVPGRAGCFQVEPGRRRYSKHTVYNNPGLPVTGPGSGLHRTDRGPRAAGPKPGCRPGRANRRRRPARPLSPPVASGTPAAQPRRRAASLGLGTPAAPRLTRPGRSAPAATSSRFQLPPGPSGQSAGLGRPNPSFASPTRPTIRSRRPRPRSNPAPRSSSPGPAARVPCLSSRPDS